ncbi:MAG: hypothetical protein ABSG73_01755 [Candidatus Aminicenantales bacterium]|jgi:hypothetical protein
MGINYGAIGVGIGLLLGVWAFIEAESVGGRIFIAATMACLFFLPVVWRRSTASFVSYLGWPVFGIGCFIFIKLRGVNLR